MLQGSALTPQDVGRGSRNVLAVAIYRPVPQPAALHLHLTYSARAEM